MSSIVRDTTSHRLRVDPMRCNGCQACVVACSLVHEGRVMPSHARLLFQLDPFGGDQRISVCRQCRNRRGEAPCASACPQGAIQWRQAGYWVVDEMLCDGCGDCVPACPFGVMFLPNRDGPAIKCDHCGGEPACVASCPSGTITWAAHGRSKESR